jgi:hypothetical protein
MRLPIASAAFSNCPEPFQIREHISEAPKRSQLAGTTAEIEKAKAKLSIACDDFKTEGGDERECPGPARVLLVYSQLDKG